MVALILGVIRCMAVQRSHVYVMPPKGPYPLDGWNRPITVDRFPSGDSVGGEILNMFNTENRLTLQRVGRRLWRISRRLFYTNTHTSILESALESFVAPSWPILMPKLQESVCGHGP